MRFLHQAGVRLYQPEDYFQDIQPEFKKLMAKKIVGSTQEDLDAIRGDR